MTCLLLGKSHAELGYVRFCSGLAIHSLEEPCLCTSWSPMPCFLWDFLNGMDALWPWIAFIAMFSRI